MPTYEYKCEKCGHDFDVFQWMTEPPLIDCPKCGEKSLHKIIAGGGSLIFQGAGLSSNYRKTKRYSKE
jgi:putative FmdB family regulatory protein